MTFQPLNFIKKPKSEREAFDGPIDRFLILIGDIVTNYGIVLLFLALFGIIGASSLLGGAVMVREINQRFNELEVREQGRQLLLEQQQEQISESLADQSQSRIKKVDESEWFVVLDDGGEPLPSLGDEPLLTLVESEQADIELQGGRPSSSTPWAERAPNINEMEEMRQEEITASN